MREVLALVTALLLVAAPVGAGTITFDVSGSPTTIATTATHDAALTAIVARINTERAARTPPAPAITVNDWLRDTFVKALTSYRRQEDARDAVSACTAYAALTGAQRSQIVTALGGKSPCP